MKCHRILPFFIVLCCVTFLLHLFVNMDNEKFIDEDYQTNPLDGCLHVYLDMGTNIGVQIRKLYEPQKFPEAKVLPVFDKYFGSSTTRNQKVCAVGFEPNQNFELGLQNLEQKYHECGWNVKIFTRTGVTGVVQGGSKRFVQMGALSGHLISEARNEDETEKVNLMRISSYIREVVAKRQLPKNVSEHEVPRVVMKLDVEGAEMEIVPDLLFTGALTHVDRLMVDWHNLPFQELMLDLDIQQVQKLKDSVNLLQHLARESGLDNEIASIDDLDDETYGDFTDDSVSCSLTL